MERAVDAEEVPNTMVDLGVHGLYMLQEPLQALATMRRDLGRAGIRFAYYDLACALYLQRTGQLSDAQLRLLFPSEGTDFITNLISLVTPTPYGSMIVTAGAFLSWLSKRFGEEYTVYRAKHRLDPSEVDRLARLEAEAELLPELPRLLAQDLNAAIALPNTPNRIVLFFDTHDALWEDRRSLTDYRFFKQDEWLRCLLLHLTLEAGIIVVVAGRTPPRWSEARDYPIHQDRLDLRHVGSLGTKAARAYLRRRRIWNAGLQSALLTFTQTGPDQIHPLYLALSADVVASAAARGTHLAPDEFGQQPELEERGQQLIDRLMKYTDKETFLAVQALSACRAFNRAVYLALGHHLHLQVSTPAFSILKQYSFVSHSVATMDVPGEEWYRMQGLLRRLFRKQDPEWMHQVDAFLEKYYRECASTGAREAALAEAIYHANQQDWDRGTNEWISAFEKALENQDMALCRALLAVRNDLVITFDKQRGRMAILAGRYYERVSLYQDARLEYEQALALYDFVIEQQPHDADAYSNRGLVLHLMGALLSEIAEYDPAGVAYDAAIAACRRALQINPRNVKSWGNLGLALQGLGLLAEQLARYDYARDNYQQALAAHSAALRWEGAGNKDFRNDLGCTLQYIGVLHIERSQYAEAYESFTSSIKELQVVVGVVPAHPAILNNFANSFLRLGQLQGETGQYAKAVGSLQRAIAILTQAVECTPSYVAAHSNLGAAWYLLGTIQSGQAHYDEAMESYRHGLTALDKALLCAPDNIPALNNRVAAFLALAELQNPRAETVPALESCLTALSAMDEPQRHALGDITAISNHAAGLVILGSVQARLTRYSDALISYKRSIDFYNDVLLRAPNKVTAQAGQGDAFRSKGDVYARQSLHGEALACYTKALTCFEAALAQAPDHFKVLNQQGVTLRSMGEVYAVQGHTEEAARCYIQALDAFEAAQRWANEWVAVHSNKGIVLCELGELEHQRGNVTAAGARFRQSLDSCNRALALAPDHTYTLNTRGITFLRWGELREVRLQYDKAFSCIDNGVASGAAALQIAPDYANVLTNKGNALTVRARILLRIQQSVDAQLSCRVALACFDRAVELAPREATTHTNKGNAFAQLGAIQASMQQEEQAWESYRSAIAAYNSAIDLAHDSIRAHRNKALALRQRGDLQERRSLHSEACGDWQAALQELDVVLNLHAGDTAAREARDEVAAVVRRVCG
jgi:tetratricopeptide (TPR) repeat protein